MARVGLHVACLTDTPRDSWEELGLDEVHVPEILSPRRRMLPGEGQSRPRQSEAGCLGHPELLVWPDRPVEKGSLYPAGTDPDSRGGGGWYLHQRGDEEDHVWD